MGRELFASDLTSLINQLTEDRSEIEFVYYNVKNIQGKMHINYVIICDIPSVVENLDLLREITANMELIRALYSKTNTIFNYSIKTSSGFEEDLITKRKKTMEELSNSEIIYSNGEYFKNRINEYNEERKSRH